MPELTTFVVRKLVMCAILFLGFLAFDRGPLKKFDTAEALKHDPKAIAGLLGALALAIALC